MMKVLETVGQFPQQKLMQIYAEMPSVQSCALDTGGFNMERFLLV